MKLHKPHNPCEGSYRKLFSDKFGTPLEDFESYKRAVESLSKSTKSSMQRTLSRYFVFLGETPDQVIANRQKDLASLDATENERYERKTKLYIKSLEEKGLAGFTISAHAGRIQGFFSNNGRRLSLDLHKLKISKARKTRKYSPSNTEVRLLIAKADSARDKLLVALMYHTGLNPIDVSGLKVGDLPQEPFGYFERSRSKTGEVMRGVVSPDVADGLKAFLTVRGETGKNEPLFIGRQGPLDSQAISDILAGLIHKAGFSDVEGFKPTALRDAFEDCLVDANLNHKVKEAFMGHVSDIEAMYGGHNRMIARMVEAYKTAYPFLSLSDNAVRGVEGFTMAELKELKQMLESFRKKGKEEP